MKRYSRARCLVRMKWLNGNVNTRSRHIKRAHPSAGIKGKKEECGHDHR